MSRAKLIMENCTCPSLKWRGLAVEKVTGNFNHYWPDRSEDESSASLKHILCLQPSIF